MEARAPQLKCLGARRGPRKFELGDHRLGLGTPAIVECGSAFIEDISNAGMQILVNYPILLAYLVVIFT